MISRPGVLRKLTTGIFAATTALLLVHPAAPAALSSPVRVPSFHAGTLDTTLGGPAGVAKVAWGDWAGAVGSAVQRNGRIVTVGEAGSGLHNVLISTRMTTNGQLDPGYGHGGVVTFSVGGDDAGGNALALQRDGKIVLAGATKLNGQFAFLALRLLANGNPDPSFGRGGVATVPIGSSAIVNAVSIQRDGKILLGGTAGLQHNEFAAARLNRDGSVDRTFGAAGVVAFGPPAGAWWMTLQRDGKILLAGQTSAPPTTNLLGNLLSGLRDDQAFMAARLLPSGALDTSFGQGGIVTVPIGDTAVGFSVAVQPDGKILLGGNAWTPTLVAATVRLQPNGALDPSFGQGGIAKLAVPQAINAMALQPDGKVLLAGVGTRAIRLLSNGLPDPTFGRGGIVTVTVGLNDAANGVTLAPGHKAVLAGASAIAGRIVLTVLRLHL
ncbi:MAG: hypothetical protein QOD66_2456 [Solirubrobacteraceae bacterium]|nr:hypothetical protein [Solirubrobacteraceae bacterium]